MSKIPKAWLRLATLLTLLTLGLSNAQAAPVSVTDDRGQTHQFAESPRRIITLLPSLTETVCALGACDRLVGVDRYSNFPASVEKLPKLGGLDDTQVETIVALRPDVVILAPSSRVQDRLSALGLKVVVLETRNHADVKRVLLTLGTLVGAPEPLKIWQRIEAALDQAAASVPPAAKGLSVYYEVDSAPYAAGESSFIGETLARLGAKNIVGKELGPFPKLNPEFIVRTDPQVIMMAQRSAVNLSNRPGWERIRALRDKRVCVFAPAESELMGRPGPRMAESAQAMARCLRDVVLSKP